MTRKDAGLPSRPVAFKTLRRLYGRSLDSPQVARFLAKHPDHTIGRPHLGDQSVDFKALGFGLLFYPFTPVGEAQKSKHLRAVYTIFLYPEGRDKHREFRRPPFGISWGETRTELIETLGLPGESPPVDRASLSWAAWRIEELRFHATFDPESLVLQLLCIDLGAAHDSRFAGRAFPPGSGLP